MLFNNQCLKECPSGSYFDSGACQACSSPCATCASACKCITCVPGFYKSGDSCKSPDECPFGTYRDDERMSCSKCSEACLGCAGPRNSQCLECNFLEGYGKSASDDCQKVFCTEGTYIDIDAEKRLATCVPCNFNCKSCSNSYSCTECKPAFIPNITKDGTTCEGCPVGYYAERGRCKGKAANNSIEICGDGLNLGQNECDDGNVIDGDGCSSSCRIEYGAKCTSHPNSPDVCVDILAPTAGMRLKSGTAMQITFSEAVISRVSSKALEKVMEVSLKKCEFTWKLLSTFPAYSALTELTIEIFPKCSLKRADICTVTFKNRMVITDLSGNSLETETVKAKLPEHRFTSSEAALVAAGTAISAASTGTLVFALGVSLLQGYAVGSLWHFVNMVQILSYIPLLNGCVPANYKIVLTDYLAVKSIVLPFDVLPDFFDPLSHLSRFLTDPLNEKFSELDYESISFIFNFGDEMLTWIVLGLLYLLLILVGRIIPKFLYTSLIHSKPHIERWKQEYKFNGVIRVLLECYLNMNFCALLNLRMVPPALNTLG